MRRLLALTILAGTVGLATGCGLQGLDGVRPGMAPSDVEAVAGPPAQIVYGDGADLANKTYVYPDGRVHFVNQQVVLVERAEDQATITDRVKQQRENDPPRR